MKKRFTVFLTVVVCLFMTSAAVFAKDLGQYWTNDSTVVETIEDYVDTISKKRSAYYIPPTDRIAVFDLNGTIMCENYPYSFDNIMLVDIVNERGIRLPLDARNAAREITSLYARGERADRTEEYMTATAYRGLTVAEFIARTEKLKKENAEGFSGMTRGEAFYKPMAELINYLRENDFTVYIVCDTQRWTARALVGDALGIPADRVIGTDYELVGSAQQLQSAKDYSLRAGDGIVFGGSLTAYNVKMNKVNAIMREIGKKPVLAFGSNFTDSSMLTFTAANNPYRSLAFMVVNDDDERDYSDTAEAEEMRQTATFNGWKTISVKKDFATIYGKGVKKMQARR